MIRALIVDDERLARNALRSLLVAHGGVDVVGEADSVDAALPLLQRLDPEVIFLDIQMPGGSGFTLFERTSVKARVIFVTAFDAYALKAFEVHALDYLLKPVQPERLAEALVRAATPSQGPIPSDSPLSPDELVCMPVPTGIRFFRVRDVAWITAADDYSELHLLGGGSVLTPTTMRQWEDRLPDSFLRIHRGTIVNVDHVDNVQRMPSDTYLVHLKSGGPDLPMSRRQASALIDRLSRKLR
jgi:two-component system LytT family response regulator